MANLSDFFSVVKELIKELGGTATYITPSGENTYDPATGSVTTTMSEIQMEGILMDLTLQSNGLGTRLGSMVEQGDKVFYARPSDSVTPALMPQGSLLVNTANDKVVVGGITYQVITIKTVDPNATGTNPVLFELYLRR